MKRMVQTVLFTALLAAMALGLPHQAQAASFNPEFSISLTEYEHGANADWTISFTIPETDINYAKLLAFYPAEFFPADSGVPLGAKVGKEDPLTTLGLLNGACNTPLKPHFDLYWASTDISSTVTFSEQFGDSNGDGLHDGIDQYPGFLVRMLPGMTPVQRMYGDANMSGSLVSINFVVLEAGALEAYPSAWGRPVVVVVDNMGDPAAEPTPGEAITDFCTPLSCNIGFFALSEDNPATTADESGYEVRRNPLYGGTYTFRWYLESMRDADGDGIENYLDTCPFDANLDNSPKVDTGPDNDGIDSACENSLRRADWDPTKPCWSGAPGLSNDCDKDGFYNRGDNCPLVANPDQEDADTDYIGDQCDPSPSIPDGSFEEKTTEIPVEISGPSPPAPAEETPTPTPTPTATPLPPETPTATPAMAPPPTGAGSASAASWPWWSFVVAGAVAAGAAGVFLAYQGWRANP